jgi:hypothetical protein
MRLMCDLIAIAFQSHRTRVASLLLCRDISGLFYPFLNVSKPHHLASHDDLSDEWERVTTYYVEQVAYLADRLAKMPEGDGTVLDHSCLLFVNNMWSGAKHESTRLPVLTVGGLDGQLQTGRVMEYQDKEASEKKLCSLYLGLMQRLGVPCESFGDATAVLSGL